MTDEQRHNIETLGLNAIEEFFKIDLKTADPKLLAIIHQRARLAMSFEREMLVDRRTTEQNYIRVFRMMATDKKEFGDYIKKSLPKYYPSKK